MSARARVSHQYSAWRHGGWYVHDVRYPNGAVGCVGKNAEGRWFIACDSRPEAERATYPTRDAAADAEALLIKQGVLS